MISCDQANKFKVHSTNKLLTNKKTKQYEDNLCPCHIPLCCLLPCSTRFSSPPKKILLSRNHLFRHSILLHRYQRHNLPIQVSINVNEWFFNTNSCTAYAHEPTVLSESSECLSSFPSNAPAAGEITTTTYADSACTASNITKIDRYRINVCMVSSVIFGPSANSGKYNGCQMMTLYSDNNCTVPISQNNITLNACASNKMVLCNAGSASKSTTNNSVSFMVGAATALIAAIVAVLML